MEMEGMVWNMKSKIVRTRAWVLRRVMGEGQEGAKVMCRK